MLVSAVGASGKTTTAHALSFDIQLPVLDLAKHKPVADNTLTGILTNAYPIEKVGAVLEGLRKGTQGIIIDGIDEGKSKTNEEAFEAFLDDLVERSKGATSTAIVVFGRSQALYSTWDYLVGKEANVGLIEIDPFSLDQAKKYIDSRVTDRNPSREDIYKQVRDLILSKLGAAFSTDVTKGESAFLSFIGYPPVLGAIATLLDEERNHHRVQQALPDGAKDQLEIQLLIRISDYLLDRDHDEKALPNFIEDIAKDAGGSLGQQLRNSLYDKEEQCARVLCRSLKKPFPRQVIQDNALNDRYEKAVNEWCKDHPFLDDTRLRNVVFAALAVTRCALSEVSEYRTLAQEYAATNRPTYHLLYIFAELAKECEIAARTFNMLMQSCSDFLGLDAEIIMEVDGDSWQEADISQSSSAELTISIEFPERRQERTFTFKGTVDTSESIPLGPYLVNTKVTLPCSVYLAGTPAIEAIGDCSISARNVRIETADLIVRAVPRRPSEATQIEPELFLDTHTAEGHAKAVSVRAGNVEIQCASHAVDYPFAKYVHKVPVEPVGQQLREKYRRLRRILVQFASHKKGGLAKYPGQTHQNIPCFSGIFE